MENKIMQDSWTRGAVVYHIYPRSFKDSNSDGIGDIKGIIEKLDYLNDGTDNSFGVNAIWLSPIYKSPMKDFGYDISDYYQIDPIFGSFDDFEDLHKECHRRGIRLIMDFVANHTSSEHPWFLESKSSKNNAKRDWYIWRDGKPDGSPPNNWLSVFGGSAWEKDATTGQYYFHTFLKEQPDLNWRNPNVRKEMERVLEFWLHRGVDGFRSDASYHLIKDDQFRDDPPNPNYIAGKSDPYETLLHTYSQGRPETLEAMNAFCNILGLHEDKFMVSEAYVDMPELSKLYQACSNNLHAPFNFNLISLEWNAQVYKKFIDDFNNSLRPEDLPTYVLGNHDRSRVATRLGQAKARIAAMLELTLRGMPFIYYGEEIGMEDVPCASEEVKDPLEKNVPGFSLGRDPERSPMQWDDSQYGGFSNKEPWLPISENYKEVNVAKESKDPKSMLNLYKTLIHYRKNSKVLLFGEYVPIENSNSNIFSFIRSIENEKILVTLNFSGNEEIFSMGATRGKIVCNTLLDKNQGEEVDLEKFYMRPNEGYVFTL